jgi:hypothetical protein
MKKQRRRRRRERKLIDIVSSKCTYTQKRNKKKVVTKLNWRRRDEILVMIRTNDRVNRKRNSWLAHINCRHTNWQKKLFVILKNSDFDNSFSVQSSTIFCVLLLVAFSFANDLNEPPKKYCGPALTNAMKNLCPYKEQILRGFLVSSNNNHNNGKRSRKNIKTFNCEWVTQFIAVYNDNMDNSYYDTNSDDFDLLGERNEPMNPYDLSMIFLNKRQMRVTEACCKNSCNLPTLLSYCINMG